MRPQTRWVVRLAFVIGIAFNYLAQGWSLIDRILVGIPVIAVMVTGEELFYRWKNKTKTVTWDAKLEVQKYLEKP